MDPSRRKWYKFALLGLAGLLLLGVSRIQNELNRQRADPKLGLTRVTPLENAPPVLAFTTVALGGFRGLIANALWIRANDLQEQGKYFEMVQLADWITKLEPTFVQVWLVQAWNMAYNISVKFTDPADRWRWLQRGIELLRDQGLRYNPKEALIYRELSWFFQHKMGHMLDDAHIYYKTMWAREMNQVLAGGHPNYPELLNPQTEEAKQRVRTLRDRYKMEPQIMKRVDELYAPMEWRLPEAHAIYWAVVGLEKSTKTNQITLRRVVYQSMQLSVRRGRVIALPTNAWVVTGPDLEKIDAADEAYEKMIAEEPDLAYSFQTAHKNFLKEAVWLLYVHNRKREANQWMKKVRVKYPEAFPPDTTLDEYVLDRVRSTATETDPTAIKSLLEGMIGQSLTARAWGEDDYAEGLELFTAKVWEEYNSKTASQTQRLRIPSLREIRASVLERLLDPQTGLLPELQARLRTSLELPPQTNSPPTSVPGNKPEK